MDWIDLAENCRACQIKTQEENTKIFILNTMKLRDIFKETTSLDIHENDGLPKVLCSICYDRLLEAYNFRKMCFAAALHFQQILSMDIPEEKYTPPEYLTDPLMPTKPDPDYLDSSNYLPEDKYSPPEEKFNRMEVPVTIDEKALMFGEENTAEDSNQISRKTKKTVIKREKSKPLSKKKTTSLPEDTNQSEKRKKFYLECDVCKLKFMRKNRLEWHMMVKHQGVKAIKCKICGQGFTLYDSLTDHMGTQHGAKRQFPCLEPGCKKHYETEEGLQKHMKSWHDPENPRKPTKKVWVCEACGKEFKASCSLRKHRYSHGITKPHACTKCPKRFPTRDKLRIHTMRHEGIKNYECTICGLKTVTARELKVHVNTHTKEKTLSCDFCPYQNVNLGNMKKHMRVVHQGVRNFHCPHCERSFGKAETLKHHVMTHTGEKPHACSECGKRFIQPTALKTHMKTHLKSKCSLLNYTTIIYKKSKSEMDWIDLAENCRACQIKTQEENTKIFIFNTMKLRDIFKETTSLDIHENDGLPKVLCSTCYDRLLEAYNFRKMCFASALQFQQILSLDIPEEKYTPPEHLSDPLMATKPDPDDSNSYSEDKYSPPEEKYNPPELPFQLTLDEKLMVDEDYAADNSLLIPRKPRKMNKTVKKQEKPAKPSEKKTRSLSEDTEQPEKRKKVNHECDICHKKFNRKDYLKHHFMSKHKGVKAFKCQICEKRLTRLDSLTGHMATQHGAKRKFPCLEAGCQQHYETEEGLQKHMKIWHDPENPKTRVPKIVIKICETCGKQFKTPAALKIHSYTHGITKPFTCTQCPRRFSTKEQLKAHTMRHKGIKNFECKICGLKKVTASELKIHVNTHTKEKILSCEFCPYQNVNLGNMKKHVKVVHQGVKDYHCPHCDKSFGKPDTLKHHVMIHTGEKPHACSECGKRFIQPIALKTHMKTHLKYKVQSK
ncbi:gastrula zinc finger protein xFG20-1-like [Phlebotomus papatasi]|uniref:gastrula zinc finger protein xFG20-1-like n=1 Tax=Phlebotomus papatasi TaxID=29031 RepID=UPI0024842796|nr:gastrula zinc finger protein xFG20-1-like [Phlebotomus papatasi]